jgi:hypothetical protein
LKGICIAPLYRNTEAFSAGDKRQVNREFVGGGTVPFGIKI